MRKKKRTNNNMQYYNAESLKKYNLAYIVLVYLE